MDSACMSFNGSPPTVRSQSVDVINYNDIFVDSSPTRQQRLLQSRNARFPAKKLSISSLSSKLTQLISNNEQDETENSIRKENKLHKSRSVGTINRKSGLSILEEISNSTKSRGSRRRPDIPIFSDNPERPLLESSPGIVSSPPEVNSNDHSPANFDHIRDSLNEMRLRDISINEKWSPLIPSPSSGKTKTRKRSGQASFDADEYIEHIEKELQQVREEAYSPLTRRPMKEKLRAANKENERLQKEIAQLKDKFEAEVKKTVEHKTATEFELRRKVRDLEEAIEQKDHLVRELQYQHEEKRLDSNVFESLKATIEKLEQDKMEMEEINLSMNKRNEVLTQLLAMSPTKITSGFNLGSPVKEKRNSRPMSLILPRQATSPNEVKPSQTSSVACSPLSLSVDISPLKLSNSPHYSSSPDTESGTAINENEVRSPVREAPNRRWTTYADLSGAFLNMEDKPANRRKARKFVAGSRQLKPLLLPTLNGDNMSLASSSASSSPRFGARYSESESDQDVTVLAAEPQTEPEQLSLDAIVSQDSPRSSEDGSPGPACLSVNLEDQLNATMQAESDSFPFDFGGHGTDLQVWQSHNRDMSFYAARNRSGSSLQAMPMPSTPESLVTIPRALFSQNLKITTSTSPSVHVRSVSCSESPQAMLNLRKRRKPSVRSTGQSPVPKMQRLERRHTSVQHLSPLHGTSGSPIPTQQTPIRHQLKNVRSHDNVVELLRQKNFAVKPLAAMTIQTAYKILSICSSTLKDFKSQPFELARRMLANAWYMHWKLLGKVSWWVLGLFIQPQHVPRTRSHIDWDHYDGESIASRYCEPSDNHVKSGDIEVDQYHSSCPEYTRHSIRPQNDEVTDDRKPGWGQSLYLWGKFSAALVLAVGGAVVKGPGEMLKDLPTTRYSCCPTHAARHSSPIHGRDHHDHTKGPNLLNRNLDSQNGPGCTQYHKEYRDEALNDALQYSSTFSNQLQSDTDSTLRPQLPPRRHVGAIFSTEEQPD